MRLQLSVTNKNFETAFALVMRDYPHLLHPSLELIKLCKKDEHVFANTYGIHKRMFDSNGPNEINNGFRWQGKSHIYLCNGRRSVPEFINTLVHELTHLQQHVRMEAGNLTLNRTQMEDEAYPAGRLAQEKYEGKF